MSNYTRHTKVSIGDGATTGTSIATIKKGDLLFVDKFGNAITTAAAAGNLTKLDTVKIASCAYDGIPIYSGDITGALTQGYVGQDFVDKSEQVTYLGFNGTNGAGIESNAGTVYRLKAIIHDDYRIGQRQTVVEASYATGASATAEELAYNIAFIFGQKEYGHNYAENFVKLERVSDGTFLALTNNASVANGSKTVTSTAHSLTGTGFIRIGGTAASVPVYGYTVIDANTLELDVEYQGLTNGALLAANIGGLSTITKWGFKLTGLEINSNIERAGNDPLDNYEWVNFQGIFGEQEDAAPDAYVAEEYTTKGSVGQGYWKQVSESEQNSRYERGVSSPRMYYSQIPINITAVGTGYGSVVIEHNEETGSFASEVARQRMTTEIYLPTGSDQATNTGDNFLAILNAYFDGVLGLGAIDSL